MQRSTPSPTRTNWALPEDAVNIADMYAKSFRYAPLRPALIRFITESAQSGCRAVMFVLHRKHPVHVLTLYLLYDHTRANGRSSPVDRMREPYIRLLEDIQDEVTIEASPVEIRGSIKNTLDLLQRKMRNTIDVQVALTQIAA